MVNLRHFLLTLFPMCVSMFMGCDYMLQYLKKESKKISYNCDTFDLEIISIMHNKNDENHSYSQDKLHKHPYYELCFVTEGYCEFEIYTKERFVVKKNSFIIFPPTCEHRIVFESPFFSKISTLYSFIPNENAESNFYQVARIATNDIKTYKSNKNVRFYLQRFLDIFKSNSMDYDNALLANFISVVIEVCHILTSKKEIEVKYIYNDKRINDVIKFIAENASNELSVRIVAEHLHISQRQLDRLFKEYLSTSPGKYIKNICIKRICELLMNTEYSLSDIAEIMKYNDTSALIKIFKSQEGITPQKYRDSILKV